MADIEADIRQAGVKDERVIQAVLQFHPGDFRPWVILPRPASVAGIAALLQPGADSKVLEVGTGTGYLTAVLAALSKRVISFEIYPAFAAISRATLEQIPYTDRITSIEGDGSEGYPNEAPYDCICVHARAREIPQPLLDQLADRGRLFIAVGPKGNSELQLVTRHGTSVSTRVVGRWGFSPLRGRYGFEKTA
jgi:protein-L-isoaspartate(D-aspartate) O-methyltransferase